MTPEQFVYWLQGFAELNSEAPSQEQWQSIKDHLSLVFVKLTPDAPGSEKLSVSFPKDQPWIDPLGLRPHC